MNEALRAADSMSRWSWEGWAALFLLILIALVFMVGRWLTTKHEELVHQLSKGQETKDNLMREIIESSRETNRTMTEILTRNTMVLESAIRVINGAEYTHHNVTHK